MTTAIALTKKTGPPAGLPVILALVAFVSAAFLWGCGSEGVTPPDTRAREVRSSDREPLRSVDTANRSEGEDRKSAAREAASDPKARFAAMERQVEEGGPETVQILYRGLHDPEPEIRQTAAEWLGLLAGQDLSVREEVVQLQKNEGSGEISRRLSDLLASEKTVLPGVDLNLQSVED